MISQRKAAEEVKNSPNLKVKFENTQETPKIEF